jgi:hypothetical protein
MKLSCPNCFETYSVPPIIMDIHEKETAAEFEATAGSPMFQMMQEIESEPVMHKPNAKKERPGFCSRHASEIVGGIVLATILIASIIAYGPPDPGFQQKIVGNSVLPYVLGIYLMPAIIAELRRHPQRIAIAALNVLLGWTLLGWVIAFVWSLTAVRQRA